MPVRGQDDQAPKRQVSRQELIAEDLLALALARNDFVIYRGLRDIFYSHAKRAIHSIKERQTKER